jgi:hypothetical protein
MSILADIKAFFHSLFGRLPLTDQEKNDALEKKAAESSEKLDWRHSIVDLMKLTGQDSSLEARAKLAKEVGLVGRFTGTADENEWLYEEVWSRLGLKDFS